MIKVFFAVLLAIALNACTTAPEEIPHDTHTSLPAPSLEKIAKSIWIHKSHGPMGGPELLLHTIALANAANE